MRQGIVFELADLNHGDMNSFTQVGWTTDVGTGQRGLGHVPDKGLLVQSSCGEFQRAASFGGDQGRAPKKPMAVPSSLAQSRRVFIEEFDFEATSRGSGRQFFKPIEVVESHD